MTPISRALSVLDAYCARNGVPADHEVVVHVREGIVARQDQGGGTQWTRSVVRLPGTATRSGT